MFTQTVQSKKAKKPLSFTFFLLSQEDVEAQWQQFSCPMEFPQCRYNWCITGENRDVSLYFSTSNITFSYVIFSCFRTMNMLGPWKLPWSCYIENHGLANTSMLTLSRKMVLYFSMTMLKNHDLSLQDFWWLSKYRTLQNNFLSRKPFGMIYH